MSEHLAPFPLRRAGQLAALLALAGAPHAARAADGRYVAVIIGIGDYAELPSELDMPDLRDDVRALAAALEQDCGYDEVLTLYDGLATRSAVEQLLFETLPAKMAGSDTLLFHFAGHGVGDDFDDPHLLPYDVDPQDLQGSAISVADLARRIAGELDVAALVVVTDAAHDARLGDLVLLGPQAKSWPDITSEFFSLSASSPKEIPPANSFHRYLADGLRGAADSSGDGAVSAHELHRFVQDQMESEVGNKSHPAESGTYNPSLVVSHVGQGPDAFPQYGGEKPGRKRRIAGAGLLALAGGLGIGSLVFYADGKQVEQQLEEPLADGVNEDDLVARHERDLKLNIALGVSAAAPALVGGALLLWPTGRNVTASWTWRF